MIDIHNHIIFEFDDGPTSLEQSMEMLKIAADQGITAVFATSHFNEVIPSELEVDYFTKLEILRKECAAKGIEIELFSGCEMFYHHYMEQTVRKAKVGTLCALETYILMEFPMYLVPNGAEETLFDLSMSEFIPIVAHPERYSSVIEDPQKCLQFIKYGALLQVNAGSILGRFGRQVQRTAYWMLENQLVHFVGSDAHRPSGRTFELAEASLEMETHLDRDYIYKLIKSNAGAIIDNVRLEPSKVPENADDSGLLNRFRQRFKSFR